LEDRVPELLDAARRVLLRSYSPYSRFKVGAALLGASGRIYAGTNVENASLGLSICAERAAIFQAVAAGEKAYEVIAICTDTEKPTPPCGACRQVLWEFAPHLQVVLAGRGDRIERHALRELMAHPFGSFLPPDRKE
jgi:cytidine deaminase